MSTQEPIYLTYDQALYLVDRIAERTTKFNHDMSGPEKAAMAQLLSEVGVKIDDFIDVSNLADNYAINAEIIDPSEASTYSNSVLEDALFYWEEEDGTHYCLGW